MKQKNRIFFTALFLSLLTLSKISTAAVVLLDDRRNFTEIDYDNQIWNTITPNSPFADFSAGSGQYFYNSTVSNALFTAEGGSNYTRVSYFGIEFSTDTDLQLDFKASFTSYDGFTLPRIAVNLVNVETSENISIFDETWGQSQPVECYSSPRPAGCQTPNSLLDSIVVVNSGTYFLELIVDSDYSGPGTGSYEKFNFTTNMSAVPVPPSLILFLSGLFGLLAFKVRMK